MTTEQAIDIAPKNAGDSPLLVADNVTRVFGKHRRIAGGAEIRAVDGVTVGVSPGETLALVGESGSGKTTLGRMMLGLLPPTSGEIRYDEQNLARLRGADHQEFRRAVQVVFQDPASSLNPRKRVWQIIGMALRAQGMASRRDVIPLVLEQLELVGLSPGESFINRFPSQLSGGQQQRIALARALSVNPRIIIADEPLSALDLSIQTQILTLMAQLQREIGVGYVLVTHDLNVVHVVAHRVAVMHNGQVVETGNAQEVFSNPQHPYTQKLLEARPIPDPRKARRRHGSERIPT